MPATCRTGQGDTVTLGRGNALSKRRGVRQEVPMADLYAKKLEAERKALWATCRLKGLPVGTPERQRIAELDAALVEHKAKQKG